MCPSKCQISHGIKQKTKTNFNFEYKYNCLLVLCIWNILNEFVLWQNKNENENERRQKKKLNNEDTEIHETSECDPHKMSLPVYQPAIKSDEIGERYSYRRFYAYVCHNTNKKKK